MFLFLSTFSFFLFGGFFLAFATRTRRKTNDHDDNDRITTQRGHLQGGLHTARVSFFWPFPPLSVLSEHFLNDDISNVLRRRHETQSPQKTNKERRLRRDPSRFATLVTRCGIGLPVTSFARSCAGRLSRGGGKTRPKTRQRASRPTTASSTTTTDEQSVPGERNRDCAAFFCSFDRRHLPFAFPTRDLRSDVTARSWPSGSKRHDLQPPTVYCFSVVLGC